MNMINNTLSYLYGPPQFRLNRGTAKKWRELLLNNTFYYDPAQLSYIDSNNNIYYNAEGLLASIVQPIPDIAWDGVSHLYDGKQFYLSMMIKDKIKLRGTLPDFSSFDHALWYLEQVIKHFQMDIDL